MSGGAFGEPWVVTHDPNYCPRTCRQVWTARGFGVGGACGCNALYSHDYGERIVACVNACAGLADPSVVPELVEALRKCADALEWSGLDDFALANAARERLVLADEARALLARIGGEG